MYLALIRIYEDRLQTKIRLLSLSISLSAHQVQFHIPCTDEAFFKKGYHMYMQVRKSK